MRRTRRTLHARLSILSIVCAGPVLAAQGDLTGDEMRSRLEERDAAIIQLQHTVRDLMTRLESVERTIDPDAEEARPRRVLADLSPSQLADDDYDGTKTRRGFAKLKIDEQAAQRALERTLIYKQHVPLPGQKCHDNSGRQRPGLSRADGLNRL